MTSPLSAQGCVPKGYAISLFSYGKGMEFKGSDVKFEFNDFIWAPNLRYLWKGTSARRFVCIFKKNLKN